MINLDGFEPWLDFHSPNSTICRILSAALSMMRISS